VENLLNKNITELLPHRKPFLFIDKVISITENNVIAEKKVMQDEEYFKGHFPKNPIVPGVLIVESMAQASGIVAAQSNDRLQDIYFLSRITDVKFKHPVYPGDTLIIKVDILGRFDQAVKTHAYCEVGGKVVAEGELVLTKKKGRTL